jgi:hypothetical protein
MAVLSLPVVLLTSAPVPRLVLLCAAEVPLRNNKWISPANRADKNEAVLLERQNI